MSQYIIHFSLAEEVVVRADNLDEAILVVKTAVRQGVYPFDHEKIFVSGKDVDHIKILEAGRE